MISVLLQHYEKARENGEPHELYVVINGLTQKEAKELDDRKRTHKREQPTKK